MPILGFYTNKEYMEGCKSSKEFGELQGKREAKKEARREYEKEIRGLNNQISLKNIAINKLVNEVNILTYKDIERLENIKRRAKKVKIKNKCDSRIAKLIIKKLKA